ncbi:unnamed protein product [Cyclocybe aegerita]|uniref:PEBP-like protein n=1 Tax=Cyclocybe aegerita TaxID=1973307 RepID=A0A8S0VW32_CYCAE|nr:unnamed protein product [Cyclocybe aegerita]
MFALRKLPTALPRPLARTIRANATLASTSEAAPSTPEEPAALEAATTQGRRKRKVPLKRPPISLENPRKWNRPLTPGVIPAYDLALAYLRQDSANLKKELEELRGVIKAKEGEYKVLEKRVLELREKEAGVEERTKARSELDAVDAELEKLLEKADILEVQSEVNLPDVRWTVSNAMADMSKVSHRALLEQKWRKDGDLDLLMERLYQMHVVPDVLPEIHPSLDLHVVARTKPKEFLNSDSKKVQMNVEPGTFLRPKQTLVPPKLFASVFHTDTRLYTMLLVDPDVPQPDTESFTTYLHWMKPNIPLSATSPSKLSDLNTHTKYIPPHPQRGTPYHRYVCLLLPQPPLGASEYTLTAASRATGPTSMHLDIPVVPEAERLGFNVREFTRRWNLNAAKGGGAHMWREVWDEDVSAVYKDILNKPEPRYSRPPKADPYVEVKQKKKYIA